MKATLALFSDLAFARLATGSVVERMRALERDLAEKDAALKKAEAELERQLLRNRHLSARLDRAEDKHGWGLEPGVGI